VTTKFLRSAFNGIKATKSDKTILSLSPNILGPLSVNGASSYGFNSVELPYQASRADLANAELLTEAQPRLGLSAREAHTLYLRAACHLPWARIAQINRQSWLQARVEYDNAAVKVFYGILAKRRGSGATTH
jgi:hypothetical protein